MRGIINMTDVRLPTDDQLWLCMSETMRSVILPSLEDPWARVALIRLIGLAEYAPKRGSDPTARRIAELIACIDQLSVRFAGIREQLPDNWPEPDATSVLRFSGQLLAGTIADTSEQSSAIQADLKTLLLAQLDDDLSASTPLIMSFGGELNEQ